MSTRSFNGLDEAHEAAARLHPRSTPEEVRAVLHLFRKECWPSGARSPGTIAWFMADFLPQWLTVGIGSSLTREPSEEQVAEAVRSLPEKYLRELASGPLEETDEADCRICTLFDSWVYGAVPENGPHNDAIILLIDWHRWWGSPNRDGLGEEAYRRCQVIYAFAREALA